MQQQVLERIDELIHQGQGYLNKDPSNEYWASDVAKAQAWMSSTSNAIFQIVPVGSFYYSEVERLTSHHDLQSGIPNRILMKLFGVLASVREEAQSGLLVKLEYQTFATAFDDFLDHASDFHRSGKLKESAVLVSVVLEDAIKRIAKKNDLNPAGITLEPLIDQLANAQIFTPVKAKRVKGFAGVRNSALHAEWENIDLKDVGQTIEGVRELLDNYL